MVITKADDYLRFLATNVQYVAGEDIEIPSSPVNAITPYRKIYLQEYSLNIVTSYGKLIGYNI